MKNILITGADGQLGKALSNQLPDGYNALTANRSALDIVNRKTVFEFFSRHEIDGVINAAAYTAVDKAETEVAQAYAINANGVENLGLAAREYDVPLVHVSTDFVFSGEQGKPYKPKDQRAPQVRVGSSFQTKKRAFSIGQMPEWPHGMTSPSPFRRPLTIPANSHKESQ